MIALPADIRPRVCAHKSTTLIDVRLAPTSGAKADIPLLPLPANTRHWPSRTMDRLKVSASASFQMPPERRHRVALARATPSVCCEPGDLQRRGTRIKARSAADDFLSAIPPSVGGAPLSA